MDCLRSKSLSELYATVEKVSVGLALYYCFKLVYTEEILLFLPEATTDVLAQLYVRLLILIIAECK